MFLPRILLSAHHSWLRGLQRRFSHSPLQQSYNLGIHVPHSRILERRISFKKMSSTPQHFRTQLFIIFQNLGKHNTSHTKSIPTEKAPAPYSSPTQRSYSPSMHLLCGWFKKNKCENLGINRVSPSCLSYRSHGGFRLSGGMRKDKNVKPSHHPQVSGPKLEQREDNPSLQVMTRPQQSLCDELCLHVTSLSNEFPALCETAPCVWTAFCTAFIPVNPIMGDD